MKTLFRIAGLFSVIFWIALTVGTFGMALIYVLLGYLIYLLARSAFISHLTVKPRNRSRITKVRPSCCCT